MNIFLVNFSLDSELGGGTAERTRHLSIYLTKAGCHCEVVAMTGNSWQQEFDAYGIKSWITGFIGKTFPIPLINPWRAWKAIRQADIIYITGYWNLLTAVISFLAKLFKKPYVLCPAGEFASLSNPSLTKRFFHALLGRRIIKGAAGFIAITKLEQESILEYTKMHPKKISITPNSVANCIPKPLYLDNRLPTAPFILFMGRLADIKGPDLLLEAYLQTPFLHQYNLVFAGPDFGMQKELERKIEKAGMKNQVHFIGFLDEKARNNAYQKALILAIPSRSEAMSLVALEAGIVGLPVLLTTTCGFDEVATIGGGIMVEPNVQSLAAGLTLMLSNEAILPLMGKRLKDYVAEKYGWESTVKKLIQNLKYYIEEA